MIYLNTLSYEKDIDKYRNNHSDLFRVTVMNEELDKRAVEIIKAIDEAEYIGNNTMINRFGQATSIKNLSSGTKILLNLRWFIKNGKADTPINITSCGNNVFPYLIDEVNEHDVYLLTCNYTVDCDKPVKIVVNNKYELNSFSDLAYLGRKLYETDN